MPNIRDAYYFLIPHYLKCIDKKTFGFLDNDGFLVDHKFRFNISSYYSNTDAYHNALISIMLCMQKVRYLRANDRRKHGVRTCSLDTLVLLILANLVIRISSRIAAIVLVHLLVYI